MQPILVTGGAGFIGAHTCKDLAAHGFLPIAFDNLSRGHRDAVQWGPFVQGDILNQDDLDRAFEQYRPKSVIHFAALAYVGESVDATSCLLSKQRLGAYQRARCDGPARGRYHRIFKFVRDLWYSRRPADC